MGVLIRSEKLISTWFELPFLDIRLTIVTFFRQKKNWSFTPMSFNEFGHPLFEFGYRSNEKHNFLSFLCKIWPIKMLIPVEHISDMYDLLK